MLPADTLTRRKDGESSEIGNKTRGTNSDASDPLSKDGPVVDSDRDLVGVGPARAISVAFLVDIAWFRHVSSGRGALHLLA